MVGAVPVVGSSSLADSKSCRCLCLDAVAAANSSCSLSGGDNFIGRRQQYVPLINTSFLDYSSVRALSASNSCLRKQRKNRSRLVVMDQQRGQNDEDSFEDIKKQILDYFTYKAVRTVLNQLYELNPSEYRWFYNYVAYNEDGYGKSFIRKLVKDKRQLAERVMVTRLHLYEKWIKKCDHTKMYERISNQNLELMRERLMDTVIWPSDDTNTEVVG